MGQHIEKRNQSFKVKEMLITVNADALVDDDSGDILSDLSLDSKAIDLAFDKYRVLNGIVSPNEIVSFRKKLNLSQRSFAKFIGIGAATVARYEKGALPTESINNLIKQLMNNNDSLIDFLKNHRQYLTNDEYEFINEMISESTAYRIRDSSTMDRYFATPNTQADKFNGFKIQNLEKVKSMVGYFSKREPAITKIKLEKLMFYADFYYFREQTKSITGLNYQMTAFGPRTRIFAFLYEDDSIQIVPSKDFKQELIIANDLVEQDILDTAELEMIGHVFKKFQHFDNRRICRFSLDEEALKDVSMGEKISYEKSFQLK